MIQSNISVAMELHDAIITWLEQGNNFLRVTNIPLLFPSTEQDGAELARAESEALDELTAFVNLSIPHANWDAKSTRLMLKQYFIEYISTVEAAANPQSFLDEKDVLGGFETVQDKLNAKCPHFQRFEQLHARFSREERQDEKKSQCNEETKAQQMTDSQLHSNLSDTQGSRKEKDVTPKKIRTMNKKKVKTDNESTATENEKASNCNEEVGTEPMLATKSGKNKKKDKYGKSQKKTKHRKSKKHSLKEKKMVPSPLLIVLSSDEEDDKADDKAEDKALPTLRRSARSKRQASRSLEELTDRSDDASLWIDKRKLRRVESASEFTCIVDALDVTLPQTTQTTYLASDGSQGPTIREKNTLSGNTPTKVSENKQKSSASKSAELGSSLSATPRRKRLVKDTVPHSLAKGRNSASRSRKSTQNTAMPNAIAQAVSQRQQLLSHSQAERCQRSTSESDYDLSDVDLPKPSVSCNGPRSSDSIRHETRPPIGLLPPLIERPLATDGRANLERKRVFLRAKELAFEQLKWQRENEFQQQELELLRYETEAREALARQELKIKQMRIRATIIQPMISAGASVADVVERLRLL